MYFFFVVADAVGETSNYPSAYSLGGQTSLVSGDLSGLVSDDGDYMTFRSYYSGTDISDFVDNDNSDMDFFRDKGTHSNFSAQQLGPDSVFDVITEEDTNTIVFGQITVSSEQSTGSTVWTDVPGAALNFTPGSSTEEWLIFVAADIRSSSTLEDQARFRYVVNQNSFGETGVQQGTTSTNPINPYNVYFHFTRVTGVNSEQNVRFQFQAPSGLTAYARNVKILCIRLDSAGLEYVEENGDISITGYDTLATLQFTPSSAGDYIIAYCALVSELPVGGGASTWLDYDSGTSLYPEAWATPNTKRIHTDRDQFEPHCLFTKIGLTATQQILKAQAQLQNIGETSTARDVRIAAFRVDAFDLIEFDEDIAVGSTTQANTVRSVVNTLDPGEQRDYLILAGIHTISSGTSSRETGGIEIDDVFVQRKGDQRLDYSEIARIASHCVFVKESSTSFKVETTYGTGGVGFDTVYSKQSVIYVLKIPENYELDLEAQWTNVPQNPSNAQLCLFGGTMSSENVKVDVWTGAGWDNLFSNLTSGWNNISASSYLQVSNFTIRFKGETETDDTTQDGWYIDAAVLHVWSNEYSIDVGFTGLSDVEDWRQLRFSMDASWTTDSVNVILQLYNYTLGDYAETGFGCIAYTSGSTPNVDENQSQIIDSDPADFRNATGYWKMRVKGFKATDAQFDLKIDCIEFEPVNFVAQPFDWFSLFLYIISAFIIFLFILFLVLRRKKTETHTENKNQLFSKSFGMTHEQIIGKKVLFEIDPTANYQNALSNFVSEARNNDEVVFIFTSANSFFHSKFSKTEDVRFFIMASKTSSSENTNKKETILPASDLSLLLDAFLRIQKTEKRKTVNIVFDNLSDTILLCGFEKTYKFTRWLLESASSTKSTFLFLFNPTAHDPMTSSSIRGLFQTRLVYAQNARVRKT